MELNTMCRAPPELPLLLLNTTVEFPLIVTAVWLLYIAPPPAPSALLPLNIKEELSSVVILVPCRIAIAPPEYIALLFTNITDVLPIKFMVE